MALWRGWGLVLWRGRGIVLWRGKDPDVGGGWGLDLEGCG